jgi:hypothetical protein
MVFTFGVFVSSEVIEALFSGEPLVSDGLGGGAIAIPGPGPNPETYAILAGVGPLPAPGGLVWYC